MGGQVANVQLEDNGDQHRRFLHGDQYDIHGQLRGSSCAKVQATAVPIRVKLRGDELKVCQCANDQLDLRTSVSLDGRKL